MRPPYKSTMPTHCVRCGCGVVSISEHFSADTEQRQAWKADGVRRYTGRGLCATCYKSLKNNGGLDTYRLRTRLDREHHCADENGAAPVDAPPARTRSTCTRCGITEPMTSEVCDDCLLVLGDLGELDRWVQAS